MQRAAQWCAARGRHDAAIGLFHNCLGAMQRMGDPKGEGIMHHNLGLAHQLKGDLRGAVAHYNRALALEDLAGDVPHLAQSWIAVGACHRQLGDYAKARECFHKAYLRAIQASFVNAQAASCQYAAEVAELQGDTPGAIEQWGRLFRIGQEARQAQLAAYAANQLARLHLEQGSREEAWAEAEEARSLAEAAKDPFNVGLALATLGELCMKESAWSRALDLLLKAERLLQKHGGSDCSAFVHQRLEQVHQALGNEAEARRYHELGALR
ncbi:MAG TPA: tetratricopeptide repeat protein [bacterium]|nr:tetratricopeptide repeat protein [bacterium]